MIKIIIKNELRNGKREPPKEGGGGGEKLHAKEN